MLRVTIELNDISQNKYLRNIKMGKNKLEKKERIVEAVAYSCFPQHLISLPAG